MLFQLECLHFSKLLKLHIERKIFNPQVNKYRVPHALIDAESNNINFVNMYRIIYLLSLIMERRIRLKMSYIVKNFAAILPIELIADQDNQSLVEVAPLISLFTLKYTWPLTLPLFFPFGSSSITPIHLPDANAG